MTNFKTISRKHKSSLFSLALATTMLATPMTAISANAQTSWPVFNGKATSQHGMSVDPVRGVLTLAPLLEHTTPAVVNIAVSSKVSIPKSPFGGQMNDEFMERFFGDRANPFKNRQNQNNNEDDEDNSRTMRSAGSGVIINASKGYVLTNYHVIDKADTITVNLTDRRTAKAKIIGSDPKTDIALLKINLNNLSDVKMANSDDVKVGDYVIAIGNAFGIGQSVTTGIVSALDRTTSGGDIYQNYIQTDAAINKGNSGGALVNSKGELVGINSAILSRSGGSNGIGFAVPTNMIKGVMNQLIEHGEVRRGRIGVGIQNISPELQNAMHLTSRDGALVRQVEADTPAAKAGLKVGDVITGFNGHEILNSNDIRNAVGAVELGQRARITYVREGKTYSTKISIAKAPKDDTDDVSATNDNDTSSTPSSYDAFNGATFTDIPTDSDTQGGTKGVIVAKIHRGSDAWEAGLRRSDIIRSVNNADIKDLGEFKTQIAKHKGAKFLNVQRGRNNMFIAVK